MNTKETSAGAVVIYRRVEGVKFLLLHYQAGHWDLPKGHIEKGESLEETVRREVFEETGINDLKFIEGFEEVLNYWFRKKKEWLLGFKDQDHKPTHRVNEGDEGAISKSVTFFLCETETQDIKISFEHMDFKWLPYEEAHNQITFNGTKGILKKANNFLRA